MDHLTIGDASVVRIEEMVDSTFLAANFFMPFDPEALQPHLHWLAPRYYVPDRGALVFSMHAWIVKTGRHTVLIDTCVGNDKERMPRTHWHHLQTPFLERLRAAGATPESIDYVMCTHLHYLFARIEYDHWQKNPDPSPIRRAAFLDSALPVVEAGRADMIEDGHQVDAALTVELAPGHTPGNVCIRLRSGSQEAIFAGDTVHHPMQAYEVDWSTVACTDRVAAAASRRKLLEQCAERGSLLLPAHFPAPYGAYVRASRKGFELRWLS